MREILFRGKCPSSDKWIYGFFWKDTAYYYILDGRVNRIVIPETVGQYTGLKDKNGTKIFEGDIVYIYVPGFVDFTGIVTYDLDEARFLIFDPKKRNRFEEFFDYGVKCLEVIGNIHDNPELLDQESSAI